MKLKLQGGDAVKFFEGLNALPKTLSEATLAHERSYKAAIAEAYTRGFKRGWEAREEHEAAHPCEEQRS